MWREVGVDWRERSGEGEGGCSRGADDLSAQILFPPHAT